MTKLNNKGISLVEILIAIAVMALLMVPIVTQTLVTLDTSSKAKEKQYVVESAEEVMEYFRKSEKADYASVGDADGVVEIQNIGDSLTATCKIYLSDGSDSGDTAKYTYTSYSLAPVKLGKKKTEYDRLVTISDLNNKLSEKGYEVDYETYVNGSTLPSELDGFDVGSDNTVAKFGTDVEGNEFISAIVCKKRAKASKDPNTESLGNIQDLDANKMAIIPGDATNLDIQLESSLTALLIQYANEQYVAGNTSNALAKLVNDPAKLNRQIKAIINNNSSDDDTSYTRLINVSVTSAMNETGTGYDLDSNGSPKYYHVKCDVIYKIKFKSYTPFAGDKNVGQLSYNVLDRDYYTTEPPDVFLVYEPLLIDTNVSPTKAANYAHDEYITIQTDKYTSGNVNKFDPSKLYLVKSTTNWSKANGALNINPTGNGGQFLDCYYYKTGDSTRPVWPVQIHINQIKSTFEPDDQEPIQIVTNISQYNDGTALCPGLTGENSYLQFDLSQVTNDNTPSPSVKADGTYIDPSIDTNRIAYKPKLNTVKDASGNKARSIVGWANDSRYDGRLYRMSVVYTKITKSTDSDGNVVTKKGEKTYLTGAKGAD